jgi:transcriptional regulator with XRE-family HTH domain
MTGKLEYAFGMELTKRIGLRLRDARKAQSLSLAALAARTSSLSKSRISNYEQGLRRMGLEEARELASALGSVTPTYLLCLDDDGYMSERESALLDLYRQADDRGRDTILRVAESQADYPIPKNRVSGDRTVPAK